LFIGFEQYGLVVKGIGIGKFVVGGFEKGAA
jgi:hypothetical protein